MKPLFAGLLLTAVTACSAWGQKGFDVVSIKPSDPLSTSMSIGISPGGSFQARGVTLMSLITQAYDVRGFQVSGAPGWAEIDRYVISTKDEAPGPSEKELTAMSDAQRTEFRERMLGKLQIMLADRFQLKLHRETKEMPIYSLTVAKSGSKLQVHAQDGGRESSTNVNRTDDGKAAITAMNVPIESVVRFLSGQVGRTVLDNTGLTEKYDFKMTFLPEMASADTTGPSLFTALQEQLGLKLDSAKGPVSMVVIDSVQKPSEN